MKLSKFDIGAEIIAILTKGMYQDPRDALREYIQNAVDANSKNIDLRIRQNSIIIIDDGIGMDYKTIRRALRVGVSDKKPGKDVGFMGIGIYSSYHICNSLTIYSRSENENPYKLFMDFEKMKSVLLEQKQKRLNNELSGNELIDLQTLLEKYISLTDEKGLDFGEFPSRGTRVELHGIEPNFYNELLDFDRVANYLRDTVPLHFDKNKFKWGEKIENEIKKICDEHNAKFDLVNLKLQVHNKKNNLYKPYTDSDFHEDSPMEPSIYDIQDSEGFLGVIWGCLNPTRNKIKDRDLRGFLIRKQGFAIGRRESVVKYFNSHMHFDRYVGEIIVTSPGLLPNASRDDFEFTNLRIRFYKKLGDIGSVLNKISNDFQNRSKAMDTIENIAGSVKKINTEFTRYENNTSKLLDYVRELGKNKDAIKSIIKRKVLSDNKSPIKIKTTIEKLESDITDRIDNIKRNNKGKKQVGKKKAKDHKIEIAKSLATADMNKKDQEYDSLVELLNDLDIETNNESELIYNLIDEKFIERASSTKAHYYNLITELKNEILTIMDEK